jgi:5-methylthioribose kinase
MNIVFCGMRTCGHALCKITEDLIFTDPYYQAPQNRWTSSWLDATAARFREDLDRLFGRPARREACVSSARCCWKRRRSVRSAT